MKVIDIGSRRELFIDEYLIESMTGAARLRLHQPAETDDVFVHDTLWEGNRTMYYSIFPDGDLYRMYYRGSQINLNVKGSQDNLDIGAYSIPYNVTCYAESRDDIRW